MSDEGNSTSDGDYLTESDIRKWIGEELGNKLQGVATKDDITTAISESFSSLKLDGDSSGMNLEEFRKSIIADVDDRIAKKSGRQPGFLTRLLTAN